MNKLILYTLRREFCLQKSSKSQLHEKIRRHRNAMNVWVDDEALRSAVDEDRR